MFVRWRRVRRSVEILEGIMVGLGVRGLMKVSRDCWDAEEGIVLEVVK